MTIRGFGLLAILFYAVHAGFHVARGQPEHGLWMCHLASLAIGLALVARWPTLNAVGVLWLAIGVPLWIVYLAAGGEMLPTSLLPHLGGLALGGLGLTRLGVPAGAWPRAFVALIVLVVVCRAATPAAADVNLAYTLWPAEGLSSLAQVAAVIAMMVVVLALLVGFERVLLKVRGVLNTGGPAPGTDGLQ